MSEAGAGPGPVLRSAASPAWRRYFRFQYRLLRILDPVIRLVVARIGLGDTRRLTVMGRRSGRPRAVLVGLLVVGGRWYVGHPNGPAQWTRNLAAAGSAVVADGTRSIPVAASPIGPGPERDRVIRATWVQHPWPGNWIYHAAARHIAAVGDYYRLVPVAAAAFDRGGDAGAAR